MNNAITKIINFYANDGKEEALKKLLISMVAPSRAEDGCTKYELFLYDDNKSLFTIVEAWQEQKYLDAHMQSSHYKHYKANSTDLIANKEGKNIVII